MPNMDGLSLLKEIRATEGLRNIPLIIVAGEAERERVLEAMRAGARGYIVKPFMPEVLRQKVLAVEKELLNRRKPTDTAVIRFTMPEPEKAREKQDAKLPFMAQLPVELIAEIYESASRSEHERDKVLVKPEDVVQSLHIIDGGEVDIFQSRGGRASDVFGRGECFGELSFLSGDPAGLTARARTALTVASVEKGAFEALLAKRPHLGLHLTRLLARRAREADAKLASEEEKGLSGRFSTISLVDLVQTLHRSCKTGLLRVHRDRTLRPCARQEGHDASGTQQAGQPGAALGSDCSNEGDIYFVDGNVRQARIGDRGGEDAFFKLMAWAEGNFTFETGRARVEQGIFRATMGLLMEGTRRQDKPGRMRA
jgi:CRP-like cAMP-binding protein